MSAVSRTEAEYEHEDAKQTDGRREKEQDKGRTAGGAGAVCFIWPAQTHESL